jgi:predicted transcriptional regulator
MTKIEISDELAAALQGMAAAEGLTLDAWLEQVVAENAATEEEEKARLEWLRAAAKEGVDAIERGEYTRLNSSEELAAFIDQIGDEVEAEFTAERRVG